MESAKIFLVFPSIASGYAPLEDFPCPFSSIATSEFDNEEGGQILEMLVQNQIVGGP